MAGFAAGLPEVDRRWLEQAPDARALFVEGFGKPYVRAGGV